jgi:hypothetical protein
MQAKSVSNKNRVMKLSFAALIMLLAISSCDKDRDYCKKDLPSACLSEKVEAYIAESKTLPCDGYRVSEYMFEGNAVYLFAYPNCIADGAAPILNAQCDTICWLGGIGGNSYCNGLRFDSAAVFVKNIYP